MSVRASLPQRLDHGSFANVLDARLSGTPLVMLLDVDGTLAPIVAEPGSARVPDDTRDVLRRIGSRPDSILALVSGRAAEDAMRVAGAAELEASNVGVWVIGNHGYELRPPRSDVQPLDEVARFADVMQSAARTLSALEREIPGVLVENKRWTLSVHYRQAASRERDVRARTEAVAAEAGLRAVAGKMVIEVRPPLDVNKGSAVLGLLDRVTVRADGAGNAAILYAGDDRTDEDAFQALRGRYPNAVTVRVLAGVGDSATPTHAEFVVESVAAVRDLLEQIDARRAPRAG